VEGALVKPKDMTKSAKYHIFFYKEHSGRKGACVGFNGTLLMHLRDELSYNFLVGVGIAIRFNINGWGMREKGYVVVIWSRWR